MPQFQFQNQIHFLEQHLLRYLQKSTQKSGVLWMQLLSMHSMMRGFQTKLQLLSTRLLQGERACIGGLEDKEVVKFRAGGTGGAEGCYSTPNISENRWKTSI